MRAGNQLTRTVLGCLDAIDKLRRSVVELVRTRHRRGRAVVHLRGAGRHLRGAGYKRGHVGVHLVGAGVDATDAGDELGSRLGELARAGGKILEVGGFRHEGIAHLHETAVDGLRSRQKRRRVVGDLLSAGRKQGVGRVLRLPQSFDDARLPPSSVQVRLRRPDSFEKRFLIGGAHIACHDRCFIHARQRRACRGSSRLQVAEGARQCFYASRQCGRARLLVRQAFQPADEGGRPPYERFGVAFRPERRNQIAHAAH